MVYSVAGYGKMLSNRVRIGAYKEALKQVVDVLQLTKVATRTLGLADRIEFIQDLPTRIGLPEQADATVADWFSRYAA